METRTTGPLTLQVEPCAEDPTRYRWVIRDRDHILRVAAYALPDAVSARAQGDGALAEVAALRRDADPVPAGPT
ncbi:hypothetical protein [Methylobacterium goesingense]|uniref:DUF1508 domain-containing protein n=1 Tax=Methylobacterium goesingense TaxID=243690 RepID=A0ABV2LBI7_9HYPH|nr:hypothetical protein [Methylobacterium goesingense]GJD74676.1 hypothetical protein CFIICLFH_2911 [Methylobacterium goesingense]